MRFPVARSISLRRKLLVVGNVITLGALCVVAALFWTQNRQVAEVVGIRSQELVEADVAHINNYVHQLCVLGDASIKRETENSLRIAQHVLAAAGGLQFSESEKVDWTAANQFDGHVVDVSLPKALAGKHWFGQVKDLSTPVPVVDEAALANATRTVFQRMNEAGDMLRIATTVRTTKGERAIGTFIPATNPDGEPNPVIRSVLSGQRYVGRAFVANEWCATAYEPIRGPDGTVAGMLYTGTPERIATEQIRGIIQRTKVGQRGYVFVLNAKGSLRGRFVVPQDGKPDGEDLRNARIANGENFIQSISQKALSLRLGERTRHRYEWGGQRESGIQQHVVEISYFEPWDWVIGVTLPEEEYFQTRTELESLARRGMYLLGWLALACAGIAAVVWGFVSRRLTGRIVQIADELERASGEVAEASAVVANDAHRFAASATAQSSAVEDSVAKSHDIGKSTRLCAERSIQAVAIVDSAGHSVQQANRTLDRLNSAIEQIGEVSQQVSGVIRVIDEIAFQTNILALNAAIEAARAGQAGAGFAVVADEVRLLSQRSAEAARQVGELALKSEASAQDGRQAVAEVLVNVQSVTTSADQTSQIIRQLNAASEEQSRLGEQVVTSITHIGEIARQTAAGAEESATAGEQMSGQAEQLRSLSSQLHNLVTGH